MINVKMGLLQKYLKKYTALSLKVSAIILCLTFSAYATERVVIIAPAAVDIIEKLGAGDRVVGVTNSIQEFPDAVRIGTHINPGIEKTASLKPTLLITTSRFDAALAKRLGAEQLIYEPKSLEEILKDIEKIALRLDRKEEGDILVKSLQQTLEGVQPSKAFLTVIYEVRSNPLSMAKNNTIIKSILESAGMKYAYAGNSGAISVEYLLTNQPDVYIYQEGPMNMNPTPPTERMGWGSLKSCIWRVNELDFARANTDAFTKVVELNNILNSESPCGSGKKIYNESNNKQAFRK